MSGSDRRNAMTPGGCNGERHRPFIQRQQKLSKELQEKAATELNEIPATRAESVEAIRDWIQASSSQFYGRTDDDFILKFLRSCKFRLEPTKTKILRYYKLRRDVPEWCQNRDATDVNIKSLLDLGIGIYLNVCDDTGAAVSIGRPGLCNPKATNINDLIKMLIIISEAYMMDVRVQIGGIVILVDMSDVAIWHILKITPHIVVKFINCWQYVMPVRVKAIHFYNSPMIFDKTISFAKLFLAEKTKNRIHAHGSCLKSIHKHIPIECLPKEYGGTLGNTKDLAECTKNAVLQMRNYSLEDEKYGMRDNDS